MEIISWSSLSGILLYAFYQILLSSPQFMSLIWLVTIFLGTTGLLLFCKTMGLVIDVWKNL